MERLAIKRWSNNMNEPPKRKKSGLDPSHTSPFTDSVIFKKEKEFI